MHLGKLKEANVIEISYNYFLNIKVCPTILNKFFRLNESFGDNLQVCEIYVSDLSMGDY